VTDTTTADPQFMTIAEIARDLRVSKMTAYRLVRTGQLIAVQINGRTYRVPTECYREYKRQLRAAAVSRAEQAAPEPIAGQTEIAPF
jgi:excisionase family DNA binding protein